MLGPSLSVPFVDPMDTGRTDYLNGGCGMGYDGAIVNYRKFYRIRITFFKIYIYFLNNFSYLGTSPMITPPF